MGNADAGVFNTSGAWTCSTDVGQWRQNRCYSAAGTGADTATWTVTIPAAGDYEVLAWWSVDEATNNRATNAPYSVNHDGGSTTIDVNQDTNGSRWNSLGTYSFSEGDYTVVLSDDANEYVIADAIWWKPVE